jgi:hypothetical protein
MTSIICQNCGRNLGYRNSDVPHFRLVNVTPTATGFDVSCPDCNAVVKHWEYQAVHLLLRMQQEMDRLVEKVLALKEKT